MTATYDFSWDPILEVPEVPEVLEVFMGENTWTRLAYGNERVGFEYLNNNSSVGFGIYGYDAQNSAVHTSSASAPAGYGPYGAAISPPAGDMYFGYRGELHIGGRIHLRNRDYDPALGIFTSPDPVDGQPGTPTANAVYPYANNDPTNNTDPLGLFPVPVLSPPVVAGGPTLCASAPLVCGTVITGAVFYGVYLWSTNGSTSNQLLADLISPPRSISTPNRGVSRQPGNTPSGTFARPLPPQNPGAGYQCNAAVPQGGGGDCQPQCDAQQSSAAAGALKGVADSIYSQGTVGGQTVAVLRVCRITDGAILFYSAGQPDLISSQIERAQVLGTRPVVRAGARAEVSVLDQARSDARLAGGFVPVDLYATNKVCHEMCEVAIESSGGVVVDGPSGGRYARWLGTVW